MPARVVRSKPHGRTCRAFWPIADPPSVVGDFFDDAQRLFASAAVVGKILHVKNSGNPTHSTGRADRARKLRDLRGLADGSPLASWGIRNAFEHIDERIDEWVRAMCDYERLPEVSIRRGSPNF